MWKQQLGLFHPNQESRHTKKPWKQWAPLGENCEYINSRNLISTTQNATAVHTVDEVPAAEQVECADVTLSRGNSPEHGFISVTKKNVLILGH
jgi:hypothetical protein